MTATMTAIASIAVGSVVLAGVWVVAAALLRGRPAVRHLLLHAALLVYLLGPLWIVAARTLPAEARRVMQPAARALAFLDMLEVEAAAPSGPGRAAAVEPAAAALGRAADPRWFLALWAVGSGLLLVRLGRNWARVQRMRLAAVPPEPELDRWIQATLAAGFPGRRMPPVKVSASAGSPLVVGVRRPTILLPVSALALDRTRLAQVLVHEMGHVLRGDLRAGLLHRIVAALHWPNPLVHLCRRALERAQEESCDDLVLAATRPADYARTLLAVATGDHPLLGAGALGMAVRPSELERRIRRVLDGHRPGQRGRSPTAIRLPSASLSTLLTLGVTALGGAGAVAAASAIPGVVPAGSLEPPIVDPGDEAQARALFREAGPSVDGAFVMIDVASGAVHTINPGLAAAAFTPVSTYKVPIAIAALETGVVADERVVAKWDGRKREVAAWNQDLDLHGAMKTSSNWYFEMLHARVGEARMRDWVDKLGFGTPAEGERPSWMDGGRVITPLQQAGFFARFAAGKLPVSPRTQEILRRILVIEERAGVTLRAKTGTARLGSGGALGWLAGTVEHAAGPSYAFATFFRGAQADQSSIMQRRQAITRRLLARFRALPAEWAP